jgi:SlyX protein
MAPQPATEAEALDARIVKLEIRVAHQDQIIDDLDKAVTGQWAQIESLTHEIKRLTERLGHVEQGGGAAPADEPPPPHY